MASIIGAIAASHTPTIGFAHDQNKRHDKAWAPIFDAFEAPKRWLEDKKPDVLIVIYNDHVSSFFLDHYSAFSLGVGAQFPVADEGGGARDLPALQGHPALAAHIGRSLSSEEFDLSFFQGRALDHGCFSPLSMLMDRCKVKPAEGDAVQIEHWPIPVIPLQVGVLQFPMPSAKRCLALGRALRRAVESFDQPLNVAIIATGGLSHQVHGERAGFNNVAWDAQFLSLIEQDPDRIAQLTQAELAELGGAEGAEVIMWLVMRGALSAQVSKRHQRYCLPSMTGIATAIYENNAHPPIAGEIARHRSLMLQQTAGIDKLPGTYPYTLERSVQALRLNRYLHAMTQPAHRAAFLANESTSFASHGLTSEEQTLLIHRDWRGLIHYGVIFFVLEKFAAVLGVSNLQVYAAMRGQALEDFLQTRNAPTALYSVGKQPSFTQLQPIRT
jgi:gallate dioxygenase